MSDIFERKMEESIVAKIKCTEYNNGNVSANILYKSISTILENYSINVVNITIEGDYIIVRNTLHLI